jgi:hypothetical protein
MHNKRVPTSFGLRLRVTFTLANCTDWTEGAQFTGRTVKRTHFPGFRVGFTVFADTVKA